MSRNGENVDLLHLKISAVYPKPYSFHPDLELEEQKRRILKRYTELLHLPEKNFTAKPNIIYRTAENPEYDEIRFEVETEPGFFVPAHMLLPKGIGKGQKLPCVLCIQGHSNGMHISIGRRKFDSDELGGDHDYALQAVRRGYIAVAMEQRGFGELKSKVEGNMCHHLAFECLMTGRTLQGERIHDVRCMVDAIETFEEVDTARIAVTGNSGGGTTSYHAACIETRLKVIMPSCSFNTYQGSILAMSHCACNYVPGISKEMEMPDLAMMIAPRPLLIVNGREDPIYPIETAEKAFEIVKEIYKKAGARDNCRHIIGNGGHRYYAADSWPVFDQYI